MFRVFDTITTDVLDYEDVDDFRESAKHSFDESVHDSIDGLCDAYGRGDFLGEYEAYLGIKVVDDPTLDLLDLIDLYC